MAAKQSNNFGIASLVLGILTILGSLFLFLIYFVHKAILFGALFIPFIYYLSIPLGLTGILAARNNKSRLATAGKWLSIIGIFLFIIAAYLLTKVHISD
jgi:hypothetical protein